MVRGVLALPESDGEAIRLFAEHDIIQVRRSKATGRILEVDHVMHGWMKPEAMYQLKKLKEMQPLLEKVMERGYRAKAALWSTEVGVHVLGTGVSVPVGVGIMLGGIGAYLLHKAQGKYLEAALDMASIFLPFGEAWLFYSGAVTLFGKEEEPDITPELTAQRDFLESLREALPPEVTEAVAVEKKRCYEAVDASPWPLNGIGELLCRIQYGPR